jgi:quercetin dioxygenase-like cupin family protein
MDPVYLLADMSGINCGEISKHSRGSLQSTERCRGHTGDAIAAVQISLLEICTEGERTHHVNIETVLPSMKGPFQTFTGDAWFDVVVPEHDYPRMRVNFVRFTPGARTAWHCHPGGQTLYVTEGRGLVQSRGGQIIDIRPGDVIYTPPGEWHWHGAAPSHFMTHLAMWEVDEAGSSATWGEHVTDDEYTGRTQFAREGGA